MQGGCGKGKNFKKTCPCNAAGPLFYMKFEKLLLLMYIKIYRQNYV